MKSDNQRKIPSGGHWKRVLLKIYNDLPHLYGESLKKNFNENDHELAKELEISGYELMLAISVLDEYKLVERSQFDKYIKNKDWTSQLVLTDKGFNTAIEIERQKSSNIIQAGLFIFTAVIGISTLFNPLLDKSTILAKRTGLTESTFITILILLFVIVAIILGMYGLKAITR